MKQIAQNGIGLVVLLLLALFANPMHLLMPSSLHASLLLCLVVSVMLFLGLVWREQADDERDEANMFRAARWSFFFGILVIVTGILVQARQHEVDPWLLGALFSMVAMKLIFRIVHHYKN